MVVFFIDVNQGKAQALDIEPKLETYYKMIGCSTIDITQRSVGGKYYDIICDDEGLLQDSPTPSAIDANGNVMLVGNLIFCLHDGEGNEVGLDSSDAKNIAENLCTAFIDDGEQCKMVNVVTVAY